MARDAGEGVPEEGGPQPPYVPDDDLAQSLEEEVARIEASNRSALASLSDDELVETLSAEVASTGDTLDAITKLQIVLWERRREDQRGGAGTIASGWIAPDAFLEGPAFPVPEWQRVAAEAPSDDEPANDGQTQPAELAGSGETIPESESTGTASAPIAVMPSAAAGAVEIEIEENDSGVVDDSVSSDEFDELLAPRPTPRLSEDALVIEGTGQPEPALRIETTGSEPTSPEFRAARAVRLFWLWFAATSSVAVLGIGAGLAMAGLGPVQVLIALVGGLALSAVPLCLGTLAGKWSGQPTMVVSRAVFGHIGNLVPALLAVVTRLFWSVAVLWFAASAIGRSVAAAGWMTATSATMAAAALVLVLAAGVAFVGYGLIARVQLVLTICSAALIVALFLVTLPKLDTGRVSSWLTTVPGSAGGGSSWTGVVGGVVLVFSLVGLAWANGTADIARYQRARTSSAASMSWATLGAVLAPLILIGYGALLAGSDPRIGGRLASDPVGALLALGVPEWMSVLLVLAVALGLLSALILSLYSTAFAIGAARLPVRRPLAVLLAAVVVAAACSSLIFGSTGFATVYRALPITAAVPVAAWAGSFAVDLMLRRRRFHGESLLRRGGVYPDWRWGNLGALIVGSVAGFGLVSSTVPWLGWEGYLLAPLHVTASGGAQLGVIVSFAVGAAAPVVVGIRGIRRQELRNK